MTIKSDNWIKRMAIDHRMIDPFVESQVRSGVISFGLACSGAHSGSVHVLLIEFSEVLAQNGAAFGGTQIDIEVDLGTGGTEKATIWTCDLSAEYVKINADYRT